MQIKSSRFIKSSPSVADCPPAVFPEYAFTGRSNVGKSSLINMLVGSKYLAKTSAMPGRTRIINHFLINDRWYIADLPGYGYAKVSKTDRQGFDEMVLGYLLGRKNLMNVFVLVDACIPTQQSDLDFVNMLGKNQIPFSIVFTKSDRENKTTLQKNLGLLRLKKYRTPNN